MKRLVVLFILLLPLSAHGTSHFGSANHGSLAMSVAALIATPERYDNKAVRVTGAWRYEFEGNVICLHREDLDFRLRENCPDYDLDPKMIKATRKELSQFNGRYVIIEGLFNARTKSIARIWRIDPWLSSPSSK